MIFCSNLPNDQDLIRALGSSAVPLPLFTDVCFSSCDGLLIACERKKVGDLADCINSGRFLAQMTACKENGADVLILVLEGRYRRSPDDGLLEIPVWKINERGKRAEVWEPVKPTMMYSRFIQYLWELPYLAGIHVIHSDNVRGTANLILTLHDWFQRPDHHSLEQFYKTPPPTVQLVRPSLVRRVAGELNGIGWEWSGVVASRFKSVGEMVSADTATWSELEMQTNGRRRRLGKKTAEKIVKSLRGE